jgi:glycogen operon protein
VNFITAHDGFTLRDLCSYDAKHNLANGEDNRDGESHNRSWNCGAEGETKDASVRALRRRQQRNLLTTLMLSQGVPMLVAGDELGRTQHGNNNAYCQDTELSWVDWEHSDRELFEFWCELVRMRSAHPVFHRRNWFHGESIRGSSLRDIGWFRPDGQEMTGVDWNVFFAKSLGVFLNGSGIASTDRWGRRIVDNSFYILFHPDAEPLSFSLPDVLEGEWQQLLNTAEPKFRNGPIFGPGHTLQAEARSIVLFKGPLSGA